jgi:hypothetical protein
MMLGETPTVVQRSPVSSVALDQHAGDGAGAAVEDAHLVVDQLEVRRCALVLAEVLAQRDVERVDRAVALGDRDQRSPPTFTFTTASETVTSSPRRCAALDVDVGSCSTSK